MRRKGNGGKKSQKEELRIAKRAAKKAGALEEEVSGNTCLDCRHVRRGMYSKKNKYTCFLRGEYYVNRNTVAGCFEAYGLKYTT
jgi:hypothetical protein